MKYIFLIFISTISIGKECKEKDKWGYRRDVFYPCGDCSPICLSGPEFYGMTGPQYKKYIERAKMLSTVSGKLKEAIKLLNEVQKELK